METENAIFAADSASAAINDAMSLPCALRRSNCNPVWATNETSGLLGEGLEVPLLTNTGLVGG